MKESCVRYVRSAIYGTEVQTTLMGLPLPVGPLRIVGTCRILRCASNFSSPYLLLDYVCCSNCCLRKIPIENGARQAFLDHSPISFLKSCSISELEDSLVVPSKVV